MKVVHLAVHRYISRINQWLIPFATQKVLAFVLRFVWNVLQMYERVEGKSCSCEYASTDQEIGKMRLEPQKINLHRDLLVMLTTWIFWHVDHWLLSYNSRNFWPVAGRYQQHARVRVHPSGWAPSGLPGLLGGGTAGPWDHLVQGEDEFESPKAHKD